MSQRRKILSTNNLQSMNQLECRLVPAAFPIVASSLAIAPDDSGHPVIHFQDARSGDDLGQYQAYEDSFRGGVNTATGDVNGDGVPDLIVAPGSGGGPRIRIVDGKSGNTLADFFVYESSYTGGVYVASGDVNGDGHDDIITGTGVGGGPRVRVLDGATLGATTLKDFFAYESSFRGGVQVAGGDVDGDGRDDIVTGTGVGGGPRVEVFNALDDRVIRNFFAYEDSFRGGVQVASGDVDGDGHDDLILGTGVGGGPVVRTVSGKDGTEFSRFFADDSSFRGGVRVGVVDSNQDGRYDVVCRVRHGNSETVHVFGSGSNSVVTSTVRVDDDASEESETHGGSTPTNPGMPTSVEGKITAIDTTAGTVQIQKFDLTLQTLVITSSTKLERNDSSTTLASFVVGDRAEALLGTDGSVLKFEAVAAGVSPPPSVTPISPTPNSSVEGTVIATDSVARTVTIRTSGGVTYLVETNSATKFERNSVHAPFAAIIVNDLAQAKIGADGLAIQVESVGI